MGTVIASTTNNKVCLGPADSVASAQAWVAEFTSSSHPLAVRTLWTGAKYSALDVPVGKEFYEYHLTGGTEQTNRWTGGSIVEIDARSKSDVEAEVKIYWQERIDEMNPVWAIGIGNTQSQKWGRWTNTRYHLDSGALCVIAACSDATWDLEACEEARDAFYALCPAGRMREWMRKHTEATWQGYYLGSDTLESGAGIETLGGDNKPTARRAYFHWTKGADIPSFGDDYATSTHWDGNNDTINIAVTVGVDPDD